MRFAKLVFKYRDAWPSDIWKIRIEFVWELMLLVRIYDKCRGAKWLTIKTIGNQVTAASVARGRPEEKGFRVENSAPPTFNLGCRTVSVWHEIPLAIFSSAIEKKSLLFWWLTLARSRSPLIKLTSVFQFPLPMI